MCSMDIKRHLIRKNQIVASLAVSTVMVIAGVTLFLSDQQSPHFKDDADYVMVYENRNFSSYKPNSRSSHFNNYLNTDVEMIEREQFSPTINSTPSSIQSSSQSSGSVIAFNRNPNQIARQSAGSGGGDGGVQMMVGGRKSGGFSASTPNMSGGASKGRTDMAEPFENTVKQKSGWDDLTPPGDDDEEFGPPLPVGDGLVFLFFLGFAFLIIKSKNFLSYIYLMLE